MQIASTTVLLADDGTDERFLFSLAARKAGVGYTLQTVPSGDEVVAYLGGLGDYADRERFPVPAVLVLDIHMAGLNGFETLEWVRRRSPVTSLPVIMLSASSQDADLQRAKVLAADDYLVKPVNWSGLLQIVKMIEDRWLRTGRRSGAAPELAGRSPVVS